MIDSKTGPIQPQRRYLNTSSTALTSSFGQVSPVVLAISSTTSTSQPSITYNGLRPPPSTSYENRDGEVKQDDQKEGDVKEDDQKEDDVKEDDQKEDDTKEEEKPDTPTYIPPGSDYTPDPTNYSSRPTYGNFTYTRTQSETTTQACVTRKPEEGRTVWVILPNPNTVTVTLGLNQTTSLASPVPEFTPPTYCPSSQQSSTTRRYTPSFGPPTTAGPPNTTKRPLTTSRKSVITTAQQPPYSDDGQATTYSRTMNNPITIISVPDPNSGVTTVITTSKNPVTTYTSLGPPRFPGDDAKGPIKQTVNPNEIADAPKAGPTFGSKGDGAGGGSSNDVGGKGGGNANQALPIVTTIGGAPIQLQPSYAVIGGVTYSYPSPTNALQPPAGPLPTNVVILDGGMFTAIGSSIAVFDGRSIRYDGVSTITTEFRRETITLGASIFFDSTTIGGAGNRGTQYGLAGGISVTQVGQSIGIISSTTFTVGPQAVITTVIIDTYTIVANPSGLIVAGTTLPFPFNPLTQVMTFGDVVLTQIGSNIIVISGSTYTIPGTSRPSGTSVNNRQTISIDEKDDSPATTTLDPQSTPTSPRPAETSKKNDARALQPMYIILSLSLIVSLISSSNSIL